MAATLSPAAVHLRPLRTLSAVEQSPASTPRASLTRTPSLRTAVKFASKGDNALRAACTPRVERSACLHRRAVVASAEPERERGQVSSGGDPSTSSEDKPQPAWRGLAKKAVVLAAATALAVSVPVFQAQASMSAASKSATLEAFHNPSLYFPNTRGGNTKSLFHAGSYGRTSKLPSLEAQAASSRHLGPDLLAGFIAACVSTLAIYPAEVVKTRLQSGKPAMPEEGFGGLYKGLIYGIGKECPNAAIYIAAYEAIKHFMLGLPFVDNTSPLMVTMVVLIAGALGDATGSFIRVPLELLNKQIQTGAAANGGDAFKKIMASESALNTLMLSWAAVLFRDMPFGALQLVFFEQIKSAFTLLTFLHVPVFAQHMIEGALAGAAAAFITTPVDVLTTRVMTEATKEAPAPVEESCAQEMKVELHYASQELVEVPPAIEPVLAFASATVVDLQEPTFPAFELPSFPTLEDVQNAFTDDVPKVGQQKPEYLGMGMFKSAVDEIMLKEGPAGFFTGANIRAAYFAPGACIFLALFETLSKMMQG
eukprot:jgi/Chlat1/550/Chrsp103S01124